MTFRLCAKHYAITLSNPFNQPSWNGEEFTKEDLLQKYRRIQGVTYVFVSRELHDSGEPHFHALISFNSKRNVRNPRFFDYNGCHPTVESAGPAWRNYCKKDGDYCQWPESGETTETSTLREAAESLDWIDYLEWLDSNDKQFAIGKAMWDAIHSGVSATIDNDGNGSLCPQLEEFSWNFSNRKSLILVGPTGCGKTTWAKRNSPKPCLLVRHADQLKEFDARIHKSIIFDDMDFTHCPRQQQIYLVDTFDSAPIHRRYGITVLPADLPRMFTCNPGNYPFAEDPAINRRTHRINIRE